MEDPKSVSDLRSAIMKLRKEVMPPVSKMKKDDLKETYTKLSSLRKEPPPAPEKKGRPEKGSDEAKAKMAEIRAKRGAKKDEKK